MSHPSEWKLLRPIFAVGSLTLLTAIVSACSDGASAPLDDAKRMAPLSSLAEARKPCNDAGDASPPAKDVVADGVALDAPTGNDKDAGCACTPGGTLGSQSLPCFCADDPCLSYEQAIDLCPPSPFPEGNRIDTYADCNLVVIEYSFGFDYGRYVYDATTHALVGGMYGTDYDAYTCGSTRVFGVQAGTFPPPECAVTESAIRCGGGT